MSVQRFLPKVSGTLDQYPLDRQLNLRALGGQWLDCQFFQSGPEKAGKVYVGEPHLIYGGKGLGLWCQNYGMTACGTC